MREADEQRQVVKVLRRAGLLFSSIPNETKRNDYQWSQLGYLKGMPDILIFDTPPNTNYRGVALEMKTTNGKLSAEQSRVLSHLQSRGWMVVVGRGAKNAIQALRDLGFVLNE